MISDLPSNGKAFDLVSARRLHRRKANRIQRSQKHVQPVKKGNIKLYNCRFQELEKTAKVKQSSVHLIATDIPYEKYFLAELDDLGQFASRVLVDGGILAVMTGKYWLNKVIGALAENVEYRWSIDVIISATTPCHSRATRA